MSVCVLRCAGNRTLAVVTKLDLMDAGTDAMDMLTGRGMRAMAVHCGIWCNTSMTYFSLIGRMESALRVNVNIIYR